MDSVTIAKLLAFVIYLAAMVFVGLSSASKNNSASDFFLGGRKLGPWLTALSAEASDSSAWLLMGLPGLCYLGGFRETFWTALGLILGTYLSWLFIAKALRKCSIAFGDSITIPEFLTNRFKDKTRVLSIVSVVFIVLFFTIYVASGFVACAKLFNSVFGLNYNIGLAIGLVVILSYTIMGGYLAVCTTDFIQGTLIFVAFVISSIVILFSLGGPGRAIGQAQDFMAKALNGNFGDELLKKFTANKNFSLTSVVSAMAWGLGYFGMPHIIVRFMGIRSNAEVTTARRVGITWMIISYIGTFVIGTLGTVYLLPQVLSGGAAETVFSVTMMKMYPAFIAGIFLIYCNTGYLFSLRDTRKSKKLTCCPEILYRFRFVNVSKKIRFSKLEHQLRRIGVIIKHLLYQRDIIVYPVKLIVFLYALIQFVCPLLPLYLVHAVDLVNSYPEQHRYRRQHCKVGITFALLPFTNRLETNSQLLCKLVLSHATLLTKFPQVF